VEKAYFEKGLISSAKKVRRPGKDMLLRILRKATAEKRIMAHPDDALSQKKMPETEKAREQS